MVAFIFPLCVCYFLFFPTLPPHSLFLCSFSQQSLNSENTALSLAKGRRTRDIWHLAKGEAKTKSFFLLFRHLEMVMGQTTCTFHLPHNLSSSQELFCIRMWLHLWLMLRLVLTENHLNRVKQVSNKLVLCSLVKMAPALSWLKADM